MNNCRFIEVAIVDITLLKVWLFLHNLKELLSLTSSYKACAPS